MTRRPRPIELNIELHGVKELKENLMQLPARMRKPTIKRAMITAAKPMAAAAQGDVAVASGKTRRQIKVSSSLSRRQKRGAVKPTKDDIFIYVGVAPSRKAHLIEFGTAARYTKTGHYTGSMPADPFMSRAFEGNAEGFLRDFGRALGSEIEKTAARHARRGR